MPHSNSSDSNDWVTCSSDSNDSESKTVAYCESSDDYNVSQSNFNHLKILIIADATLLENESFSNSKSKSTSNSKSMSKTVTPKENEENDKENDTSQRLFCFDFFELGL